MSLGENEASTSSPAKNTLCPIWNATFVLGTYQRLPARAQDCARARSSAMVMPDGRQSGRAEADTALPAVRWRVRSFHSKRERAVPQQRGGAVPTLLTETLRVRVMTKDKLTGRHKYGLPLGCRHAAPLPNACDAVLCSAERSCAHP